MPMYVPRPVPPVSGDMVRQRLVAMLRWADRHTLDTFSDPRVAWNRRR